DGERGGERHPRHAAAHHRREPCRGGGRHHRPGRRELPEMSAKLKRAPLAAAQSRASAAPPRHFLDLDRIEAPELRHILDLAPAYKRKGKGGDRILAGKTLAMIFEKPSTRTRVSFEVAMRQLGGEVVILGAETTQLARGETVADTARVLSRYVDAIMIRTTQA